MNDWRQDVGPCPICGAPHTACTTDSGPIVVPQLPARDAMAARPEPEEETAQAPATFTTATYRGKKAK